LQKIDVILQYMVVIPSIQVRSNTSALKAVLWHFLFTARPLYFYVVQRAGLVKNKKSFYVVCF